MEKIRVIHILCTFLDAASKSVIRTVDRNVSKSKDLSILNKGIVLENYAIFALELVARSIFYNREYARELFPTFMCTFEAILECYMTTNSQQ